MNTNETLRGIHDLLIRAKKDLAHVDDVDSIGNSLNEAMEQVHLLRHSCGTHLIGKEFKVLDQGYIRVVDFMGDDAAVVDAARISYGKGTRKLRDDRNLIRYLMRHRHTTPFEMCEIKLGIRCPMDVWRQWIRHRTVSVNEYSTRYSEAIDARMVTQPDQWRKQSTGNRQGSGGYFSEQDGKILTLREGQLHELSTQVYQERLDAGVAREQARKDLPLSTYTEAYWKVDLHNLLHFLDLRMDSHAQQEIRAFADIIGNEIVARWVPETWDAFLDYGIRAVVFSSKEQIVLYHYPIGRLLDDLVGSNDWEPTSFKLMSSLGMGPREKDEFKAKLRRVDELAKHNPKTRRPFAGPRADS